MTNLETFAADKGLTPSSPSVTSAVVSLTVPSLSALLRSAADAHHLHELTNGPDPDWPMWYARHILNSLTQR
jgi:hypothetical protein